MQPSRSRSAFSLVELIIVIVIIGIIGAIAIPRVSKGTSHARDKALRANLAILRSAIEVYAAEHEGIYPTDDIIEQLTMSTDIDGDFTQDADAIYGPYLKEIPVLPVGTRKGNNGINTSGGSPGVGTEGWLYNTTTNEIRANLADTEIDPLQQPYNDY